MFIKEQVRLRGLRKLLELREQISGEKRTGAGSLWGHDHLGARILGTSTTAQSLGARLPTAATNTT